MSDEWWKLSDKQKWTKQAFNSLHAPFFDLRGQKSDNLDALFSMELLCHENWNVE